MYSLTLSLSELAKPEPAQDKNRRTRALDCLIGMAKPGKGRVGGPGLGWVRGRDRDKDKDRNRDRD